MLEAEYFIFCSQISQDARGRNLLGAFDMLIAQQFPTRHNPFHAQVLIRAKKAIVHKDLQVNVVVELAGKQINKTTHSLKNTYAEKGSAIELNLDFHEIIFPEANLYDFKIYLDDKLLITRTLRVRPASELTEV